MKTKKLIVVALMLSIVSWIPSRSEAQGAFQNLGFESASLSTVPGDAYGSVQFAQAFPGWTGLAGTNNQTTALYNRYFLDSSGISIIDSGWTNPLGSSRGLIEGSFTAILQSGVRVSPTTVEPLDCRIGQTGLVPVTAQSLLFKAQLLVPGPIGSLPEAALLVTLGGQQLSFTPIAVGPNFTTFAADVHPLAGQTAELDFTLMAQNPHTSNRYLFLDSIEFSSSAVPEPSVLALAAGGAAVCGVWSRERKARSKNRHPQKSEVRRRRWEGLDDDRRSEALLQAPRKAPAFAANGGLRSGRGRNQDHTPAR